MTSIKKFVIAMRFDEIMKIRWGGGSEEGRGSKRLVRSRRLSIYSYGPLLWSSISSLRQVDIMMMMMMMSRGQAREGKNLYDELSCVI